MTGVPDGDAGASTVLPEHAGCRRRGRGEARPGRRRRWRWCRARGRRRRPGSRPSSRAPYVLEARRATGAPRWRPGCSRRPRSAGSGSGRPRRRGAAVSRDWPFADLADPGGGGGAVIALVALVVVALPTSFSTLAPPVTTRSSSTPRPLAAERSRNVCPTCHQGRRERRTRGALVAWTLDPDQQDGRAGRGRGAGGSRGGVGGRLTARDHEEGGEQGHGRRHREGPDGEAEPCITGGTVLHARNVTTVTGVNKGYERTTNV